MTNPTSTAAYEVRFRSLFVNNPDLILYQNEEGIILDANPAFLSLVRKTQDEVLLHPYSEFLSPEVRLVYREKLREAFTGKTVRFEMRVAHDGTEPRDWDVVKVPLIEHQQVLGVHMIARDITDQVAAQQDLARQNKDLQQFTYMVSHNLRAPLTNALGLTEMLGFEDVASPDFEVMRNHLLTSLNQLDEVLGDMNSILEIRDKHDLAERELLPLAEVVGQAIGNLQELLDACGGNARADIPAGLLVQANRAYLYSIFFNLLSNAIKYRSHKRPLQVVITAISRAGQPNLITVIDNGLGFDRNRAGADVFKLYKRFHATLPGRGLGLYLIRIHTESMGGQIEVSSQIDAGTRFSIQLPYATR